MELLRSIYGAWEEGDFNSVDWADPDIEFVVVDGPTPGRSTGVAEMAASWRDVISAYDDFRTIADGYHELDAERILVFTLNSGRGKASGLEVADMEPKGANLLHVRDGKVTRLIAYWNRDRALADLGLAPEAGPHQP